MTRATTELSWHPEHVTTASVTSRPNTSASRPAIAFASSVMSPSSEALPADRPGGVPQLGQPVGDRLDERGGTAHVDLRALLGLPGGCGEHVTGDPAGCRGPVGGCGARVDVARL